MASIRIQVRNGQEVVAPTNETELQFPFGTTRIKFFIPSGTVQVSIGQKNTSGDVIGGTVHAFATSDGQQEMKLSPGDGTDGNGQSLYIKGSGTIVVTFI